MKSFLLENAKLTGDDDAMLRLSKAFRGHQTLEEFTMSNVTLADESVDLDLLVSMLLVSARDIKTLRLDNVKVKSGALSAVGYNSTLTKLVVTNCKMTDKDAIAIAAAAGQCPSMKIVDVSSNDMSDLGWSAFHKAAEKNLHLEVVQMEGNHVSSDHQCIVQSSAKAA